MKQTTAERVLQGMVALQVLLYLAYATFIFAGMEETQDAALWGNIFITSISFLGASSFAFFLFAFKGKFNLHRRGNILFLIALVFFFLGDLYWLLDEVVMSDLVPIGGIPDILWNIAYLVLIGAFFYFVFSIFTISRFWSFTLIGLGISAGITHIWIALSYDFSFKVYNFAHLIQELYPAYDLILLGLFLSLLAPLIAHKDRLFVGIYLWLAGLLARLVHDNLFSDMVLKGTYYTGHWIDLLYILCYVAVGISTLIFIAGGKK